jgi:hypothetical protein
MVPLAARHASHDHGGQGHQDCDYKVKAPKGFEAGRCEHAIEKLQVRTVQMARLYAPWTGDASWELSRLQLGLFAAFVLLAVVAAVVAVLLAALPLA